MCNEVNNKFQFFDAGFESCKGVLKTTVYFFVFNTWGTGCAKSHEKESLCAGLKLRHNWLSVECVKFRKTVGK